MLDVEGGYGDAVMARLRRFVLRSKVEMEPLAWRCLSLRGPAVGEAAAGLLAVLAERGVLAIPFEWNGWEGTDLLGPEDVVLGPDEAILPAGVVPCGPEAVEACRIVVGIPAMGTELTDKTIAAEAGLVERTVSFTKGCYTGTGTGGADRRPGLQRGPAPGRGGGAGDPAGHGWRGEHAALARGMTLHGGPPPEGDDAADDKVVGTITSAAWSAELGAWVALGYLHRSAEAPGPIRVRSGDGLGGSWPARAELLPLAAVAGAAEGTAVASGAARGSSRRDQAHGPDQGIRRVHVKRGYAPQLQPDVTEHETTEAQLLLMRRTWARGRGGRGAVRRCPTSTSGARWAGSSVTVGALPSSATATRSGHGSWWTDLVKVIQVADDGTEMAAIEVDDFTIEVIYSGIAEMLRRAASNEAVARRPGRPPTGGAPAPREDPQPDPRLTHCGRRGPGSRRQGDPGRWTGGERAATTLKRHGPPTWRTSSPPTGPVPQQTGAHWGTWSNGRRTLPPTRDFTGALKGDGLTCIAEIKRRSPSKGDLDPGLQPDLVAKEYVAGGAACLSVLTDAEFFGGSPADLALARQASGLPVLRKDFTVQEADVADARLMGADAVLLIVAALDDDELRRCAALAAALGLAALVEVHDEVELERALAAGASWSG